MECYYTSNTNMYIHLWISFFDAPTFAKKANEALLMF